MWKITKPYVKNVLEYCEKRKTKIRLFSFVIIALGFAWYSLLPPLDFPAGRIVTIETGSTLSEIAELFSEKDVVHSKNIFSAIVTLQSGEGGVLAGDYFFEYPITTFSLAKRVTRGEFGLEPVRVTIHEGLSVQQIADVLAEQLDEFDKNNFLKLTEGKEGYLFPDTYLFLPNVKEDQVLKELEDNFERRLSNIKIELDAVGKSLEEIIIMASIIEREAWKETDQKLISGVLWKRIEIGMPLQVDATFAYVNGKNTYELTYDDLEIDSPYNTYKYRGLPVGPIANPGLGAIEAAINPEESPYLFYLADREGNTYYAETFEGHKRNRALYMN